MVDLDDLIVEFRDLAVEPRQIFREPDLEIATAQAAERGDELTTVDKIARVIGIAGGTILLMNDDDDLHRPQHNPKPRRRSG